MTQSSASEANLLMGVRGMQSLSPEIHTRMTGTHSHLW